jgi:assimilatory nitrate reductase catalytic subunit
MAANINHNSLVQASSRLGEWVGRARVSDKQKVGNVFVPMHWNDQNSNCARIDALIMPVTDPISGQPEFKQTPVRISPYRPAWQGVIISREPLFLDIKQLSYWVKILSDNCWRYELAGKSMPDNWPNWVREQCGSDLEWLEYHDRASGRYRSANIVNGKLNLCVFIGTDENLQSRRTLVELFAKEQLTPSERIGLLTGQPEDREVTVCSCLNIGENTLVKAIREQELTTPEAISEAVRAGSNCGTCIPELKALIAKVRGGK